MTAARFTTHDAYIAAQPAPRRKHLRAIRAIVGKAVPNAVEVMSYGMPAYKLDGRILLYFAAWQEHVAIYPGSATALAAMAEELTPYRASKGTLRFEAQNPLPRRLIGKIAKLRRQELAAVTKARPRTARPRASSKPTKK